ncbi:hypothetical protein ACJX0J_026913, partial [Zea mays]
TNMLQDTRKYALLQCLLNKANGNIIEMAQCQLFTCEHHLSPHFVMGETRIITIKKRKLQHKSLTYSLFFLI